MSYANMFHVWRMCMLGYLQKLSISYGTNIHLVKRFIKVQIRSWFQKVKIQSWPFLSLLSAVFSCLNSFSSSSFSLDFLFSPEEEDVDGWVNKDDLRSKSQFHCLQGVGLWFSDPNEGYLAFQFQICISENIWIGAARLSSPKVSNADDLNFSEFKSLVDVPLTYDSFQ